MMKIKKGDTVKVIAGKDKDKEGKVLAVKDGKVLVEGVNMVTKHTKPSAANQQGGIVNKEAAIDASNVMHVCASCGDVVRVKHEVKDVNGKQKSVRVCPKCGASLDEKKPSAKKVAKKAAKKKAEKSEDKKD